MSIKGNKISTGVLSSAEIKNAIDTGVIRSVDTPIDDDQIQPASLDLRLGKKVYRLISSFLPEDSSVEKKLHSTGRYGSDLVMYETDISEGGILEKGHVYLIPLQEELRLPGRMRARANPKSTTGRLDIFARVITDSNPRFDDIAPGYKGQLFVEVMPRSFAIKVEAGLSLVQLRLARGESELTDPGLKRLHAKEKLLFLGSEHLGKKETLINDGLFMSVDLSGDARGGLIGYKSKKNSHVVDLTKKDHYKITDFWEPIHKSNARGGLILEPEEFYILSSKERIRIPMGYAAEMIAYEAGSGELRTHYAGFFDPGFGYGATGEIDGSKAVLEVRAHDVPFMITDGQSFCKLKFEKMAGRPDKVYGMGIGSSYQGQGIALSKQFKDGQKRRKKVGA